MTETSGKRPSQKPKRLKQMLFSSLSRPSESHDGHKMAIEDLCVLEMVSKNVRKSDESRPCIVAAFDMDQTLITTKSGLKFGRNGHDWKFLDHTHQLPQKLAVIRKENPNHRVVAVIFTNQNGCLPKFNGKSLMYLRQKLTGIFNAMPVFDYAFAAMKAPTPELKQKYRKPGPGMFTHLQTILKNIDMDRSFYVGDAAGRPNDHSADDLGFAEAAGLKFFVPEEYFTELPNELPNELTKEELPKEELPKEELPKEESLKDELPKDESPNESLKDDSLKDELPKD